MSIAPGTRLGPYEVLSALAAGGMGEVYDALDTRLNRRVALKVLPREWAANPERLQRFEQEARSASALNHPNIVTVYDTGHEGPVHYIAMEFVDGRTLRAMLKGGALRLTEVLEIASQLARALTKAHEAGIVHRDLKPENVMVTADGYVKLLDFGLAKLSTLAGGNPSEIMTVPPSPSTTPGAVLGTVGYMAPEQARGRSADASADQFSLGAIVYEMTTGERAFSGSSSIEILAAIIRDPPGTRTSLRSLPQVLSAIVSRCLEKDPAARYGSTRELAAHLDQATGSLATPITIDSSGPALLSSVSTDRIVSPSIAVLPFSDMSSEQDQEYFCDGLAEELIADLGRLDGVRVASRTAAFQFKGRTLDLAEIGRRLNVSSILEGAVRKSGTRVRVTVQLTSVADGFQLWSERYDRTMDDIFAIQDDIARATVDKLRVRLTQGDVSGVIVQRARRRTEDTEAYQEYLRGRFHWNRRTPDAFQQAHLHFQRAVERDPTYALAHVGLADTFNVLGYYSVIPPLEAYPKAKAASGRALEMDDRLAEAHASLGFSLLFYDRDWDASERSMRQAIEIDPSYASGHQWLGWVLLVRERFDEAVEALRRAEKRDPLSPIIACHLAYTIALSGKLSEAANQLRATLLLNSSFPLAHYYLGSIRLAQGRSEDAIQSFRTAVELSDGRIGLAYLGLAFGVAGRRDEASSVLQRFEGESKTRFTSPLEIALVQAGLGETDTVFESLAQARDLCISDLVRLKFFAWPDPVRTDSRFAQLLVSLGLVEPTGR